MAAKKRIAILGSTGSIGTQTLDIVNQFPDQIEVDLLTAHRNADLLIEQSLKHKPNHVVIADENEYLKVKDALQPHDIKVYAGADSIEQIMDITSADTIVTAMVGYSGLKPTIRAIQNKKRIALANKETLVVAGALINQLCKEHASEIIPVDSEHSALFQCLVGESSDSIHKLILTASGGPFRAWSKEQLTHVKPEQALKHPNWSMGAKITIDSASMMNKGLEVIEAHWLFGIPANQIEVCVHPQSIIHSMVEFNDGSIKAQMGLPDMKLPIQYAIFYPNRQSNSFPRLDFRKYPQLTFESVDMDTFLNLKLAYEAIQKGGNAPCVLNAANEIAVEAFLQNKISFLQIAELNQFCLHTHTHIKEAQLDDLVYSDESTRRMAKEWISTH